MTYPKGSSAGLKTEDKGICTTEDANGGKFDVTRTKFSWDVGLVLRDWRYVVRTVKNCLKKQFKHAKNVRYGISEVAGQDVDKYDGIPIAICDALEFGESKVPFDA